MKPQIFLFLTSGFIGSLLPLPSLGDEGTGSPGDFLKDLFSGLNRLDLQVETLHSSDVDIDSYSAQFELRQPNWNFSVTAGYTEYDANYQPAVVGTPNQLSEQSDRLEAKLGFNVSKKWSIELTAREYDGHQSYRSIWIAEYYRQLFGLVPAYEEPDPRGYSSSVAVNYDYAPGHTVRLSAGYGRDYVAPGWFFGPGGLTSSNESRFRRSGTLRFEDIWTFWLKSEHIISVSNVSDRSDRWSIKSSWHVALGDDWTLRASVGFTKEEPQFDADYYGLAVEWNITGRWYLSANMEVYSDTGEIPNAGFSSTSAPGLDTMQYGAGLRWVGEASVFKVYVGTYENDYARLSPANQIFRNLYRDRDWTVVQLAYTYSF